VKLSEKFSVEQSPTLAMARRAKELIAKGIDIVRLDVGEPDFPTPKPIIEAAYNALKQEYTKYVTSKGIPELREEISKNILKRYGVEVNPEKNVIVTPGSKYAIYLALKTILDPGEAVVTLSPMWPSYSAIIKLCLCKEINLKLDYSFKLDLEELERILIDPDVRVLIVNSPNNPAGYVFDKDTVREIYSLCTENEIVIISDEIYSMLTYDVLHHSFIECDRNLENVIVIEGFSKAFAMTGWRVGYVLACEEVVDRMARLMDNTITCVPPFIQFACKVALEKADEIVSNFVREYSRRRELMVNELRKVSGVKFIEPKGAFYVFADFKEYSENSMELSMELLEKARVSTVPGAAFGKGWESYLRLSFSTDCERIREGVKRIKEYLEKK